MNTKDYFKDLYTDFYGVESGPRFAVKVIRDNEKEEEKIVEKNNQEEMINLIDKINNLDITEESKNLLKKIVEYMRKYQSGLETQYVPFRLIINVNNTTLMEEIVNVLYDSAKYYNYLEKNEKKEISFYSLEDKYTFSDYGLILMNSISGINIQEDKMIKKFIYELSQHLDKNTKCMTLISGNNEELSGFFLGKNDFKTNYFDFEVIGINPDIQDIYNEILEKTKFEKQVELLDYISLTYNKEVNYIDYKNDLIKYISFNKEIPLLEKQKTIEEVFSSLNELVGLDKVKKVLYELVDVINLKEKAGDDLKIKDINLHMVFLGNPGTGKTTIARLISDILYNLKYIKENKLIEASVKDQVAEYVGQTAPKTMSVIEKALNGVLFIDEAYTLAAGKDNTYNQEAIATLIQAMENYRDKLVVIFAGYNNEMQAFLDSNSGITSRIGYTLQFEDYTTDELIKIFMGMATKAGFIVEEDAIKYLEEVINKNRNVKNFGNARFVRNIYEKTVIKHASNVKDKKQKKILKTITKEDISIENLIID